MWIEGCKFYSFSVVATKSIKIYVDGMGKTSFSPGMSMRLEMGRKNGKNNDRNKFFLRSSSKVQGNEMIDLIQSPVSDNLQCNDM